MICLHIRYKGRAAIPGIASPKIQERYCSTTRTFTSFAPHQRNTMMLFRFDPNTTGPNLPVFVRERHTLANVSKGKCNKYAKKLKNISLIFVCFSA